MVKVSFEDIEVQHRSSDYSRTSKALGARMSKTRPITVLVESVGYSHHVLGCATLSVKALLKEAPRKLLPGPTMI